MNCKPYYSELVLSNQAKFKKVLIVVDFAIILPVIKPLLVSRNWSLNINGAGISRKLTNFV